MKPQDPDISVVAINYNGLEDTSELIDSVRKYLPASYELIVVDNDSKYDEAQVLSTRYPDVKVLKNEENRGFAGGNNRGIQEAKGEYILFLNNDTVLKDHSIRFLLQRLQANDKIAGVSPKIKREGEGDTILFAGYTLLSAVTLRNRTYGYGEEDRGQYDEAQPTAYLHGAAMMVRKSVIREVGLMPEDYFLYYEELDWCTIIKNAGYELWYEPASTVYHKESKSVGEHSALKVFYLTRNRLLYASRHRYGLIKCISLLYQLSLACPKSMLIYCVRGRLDLAQAVWCGYRDYFKIKKRV